MAKNAKLTYIYYDFKGRGEATRLLLHAAGKEFEDKRIGGEDWQAYKPKTPMGQLPILEIDGKPYFQSHAFNRYLADELGLGGKDRMESLRIDQIVQLFEDVLLKCIKVFTEKDEAKKEEFKKESRDVFSPKAQAYIENQLKENGTGYLVGNRLTLADITVFDMMTGTPADYVGPVDKFPLLKALVDKVGSNPGIKAYLEKQAAKK